MSSRDQQAPDAVPAATVVLVRNGVNVRGTLEAFLVERPAKAAFLPRAHVFPGGRVDPADADPRLPAICDGARTLAPGAAGHDAAVVATHGIAAIRELFEEAGVLLARCSRAAGDAVSSAELATARDALRAGTTDFPSLCLARAWRPSLDRLTPLAHWVTPELEPRRFDTRFFLAALPAGQQASADGVEAVSGAWLSPGDACDRYESGQLALAPPTVRTLADLAQHSSVAAAIAWARTRPHVRVLPRPVRRAGQVWLVLPGDPLHGDSGPGLEPPTRYVERDGRWRPVPPDE